MTRMASVWIVLVMAAAAMAEPPTLTTSSGNSDPVPVVDALAELQAWERAWEAFENDAANAEAQGYQTAYQENDLYYTFSGGQQMVVCDIHWWFGNW